MLIMITNRCHMGCPHCMQDAGPDGRMMNDETFDRVLEFCREALIQQMSDPAVFQWLFIDKDQSWNRYSANDILKDAAKTVSFDDTYKELQDGIVSYIRENHMKILHEVAINMFIDGLSHNIVYNDVFRDRLRADLNRLHG